MQDVTINCYVILVLILEVSNMTWIMLLEKAITEPIDCQNYPKTPINTSLPSVTSIKQ